MKDSRINILFLITFSTVFDNFIDMNWFYWLKYIATVLDQELLDYRTTNNPRYSDKDIFFAISCNIQGTFLQHESNYSSFFWGGGGGLPALRLKASTPRTDSIIHVGFSTSCFEKLYCANKGFVFPRDKKQNCSEI